MVVLRCHLNASLDWLHDCSWYPHVKWTSQMFGGVLLTVVEQCNSHCLLHNSALVPEENLLKSVTGFQSPDAFPVTEGRD